MPAAAVQPLPLPLDEQDKENQPQRMQMAAGARPKSRGVPFAVAAGVFDSPLKPQRAALPAGATSPQRPPLQSHQQQQQAPVEAALSTPAKCALHTESTGIATPIRLPSASPAPSPSAATDDPAAAFEPPPLPASWRIDPRDVQRVDARPLGVGAYGSVYRALWHGMLVAVKELDGAPDDPMAHAEFKAELDAWSRLRFPSIVQLYGAFNSPALCLVMQLMPHGALSDHIHGQPELPFPWGTLLRLAVQVAGALTYMHAAGVVHRDIKSFNVLLNEEGDAHLSDFGLSVYIGDEEEGEGEQQQQPALPSLFASLKQSPCASPVRSPVRSGAPSAAGGVALAIAPPSPFSPHQVNFTPKKPAKHAPPSLPLSRGTHPHQQPDLLRCSPPRLTVPLPAHSPARIRTPRKLDLAPKQVDPLAAQPAPAPALAAAAAAAPASKLHPYPHSGVGLPGETGGPLGTYGFMSPELYLTGKFSRASDCYAFGCTLWEFAARAVPWGATPPLEIACAVVAGERPAMPARVPPAFAALVRACWAQLPADRPSMAQVHEALVCMAEEEQAREEELFELERLQQEQEEEQGRRDARRRIHLQQRLYDADEADRDRELGDEGASTRALYDLTPHSGSSCRTEEGDMDEDDDEELHLHELVQLSAEDVASLTRSERAYYNAQLRRHHALQVRSLADQSAADDEGESGLDPPRAGRGEIPRVDFDATIEQAVRRPAGSGCPTPEEAEQTDDAYRNRVRRAEQPGGIGAGLWR